MPISKQEYEAQKQQYQWQGEFPDLTLAEISNLLGTLAPQSLWSELRWHYDIKLQVAIATLIHRAIPSMLMKLMPGVSSATDSGLFQYAQLNNINLAELHRKLGSIFIQDGEFDVANDMFDKCESFIRHLPEREKNTYDMLTNLNIGKSVIIREKERENGKADALKYLQRADTYADSLVSLDELLAKRHKANIARERGLVYLVAGDFHAAKTSFDLGIEYCNHFPEQLGQFKIPLINYAALCLFKLHKLEQDPQEANVLLVKSIEAFECANNLYHELPNKDQVLNPAYACQDYASHLSHYAMALKASADQGHNQRAVTILEEALVLRQDLQGALRNRVAETMATLAEAYEQLNDSVRAIFHYKNAIAEFTALSHAATYREKIEGLSVRLETLQKGSAARVIQNFWRNYKNQQQAQEHDTAASLS